MFRGTRTPVSRQKKSTGFMHTNNCLSICIVILNREFEWNLETLQWFTYFLILIKLLFITNDRFRHLDPILKGIFLRERALTRTCVLVPLVCHLAQTEEQYITQT
jgi:phosphatidylserine synthase